MASHARLLKSCKTGLYEHPNSHASLPRLLTFLIPCSGKLSWDKTFAFLVNFAEKLSRMGRGLHVVTWSHLILLRITKNCRRMESYSIHTSVRGYHVYKDVWEAALGQLLPCQREPNIHDPYTVAVVETGVATRIVGHVPRAISSVCYYLTRLSNTCKRVNEFG